MGLTRRELLVGFTASLTAINCGDSKEKEPLKKVSIRDGSVYVVEDLSRDSTSYIGIDKLIIYPDPKRRVTWFMSELADGYDWGVDDFGKRQVPQLPLPQKSNFIPFNGQLPNSGEANGALYEGLNHPLNTTDIGPGVSKDIAGYLSSYHSDTATLLQGHNTPEYNREQLFVFGPAFTYSPEGKYNDTSIIKIRFTVTPAISGRSYHA